MNTAAAVDSEVAIRFLAPADLEAVVAIDAEAQGRRRHAYIERRLRAAEREPALHVQFGAAAGGELRGCILARVLSGEFGRPGKTLQLELFGVRREHRRSGVGQRLFDALVDWARRHGVAELRTQSSWRDTGVLAWFDRLGFELAPDGIVECSVDGGRPHPGRDMAVPLAAGDGDDEAASREIDYGRDDAAGGNDHERLARDRVDVRSMTPDDLDAIVRIDRRITGADRSAYIAGRLAEAMHASGVRVSLSARADGALVGYLMARADLGDYGRTEPAAVIDTLGVDPGFLHHGIGRALLSQLFANLGALRVERVETIVPQHNLALLGFLYAAGFVPAQQLSFVRPVR